MKNNILALLLAATCGLASAAEYDKSIDVQFPDTLGKLRFKEKKEFPQAALGVNYAYESPQKPMRGSIFIYTGGLSSIPAGTDSPAVQKHFEQVIREVKALETQGHAKAITLSAEPNQATQYSGCGPQFLWRSYEMNLDGVRTLQAYTYLTSINNNFVKLRITYDAKTADDKQETLEFVAALRKVLGHCK